MNRVIDDYTPIPKIREREEWPATEEEKQEEDVDGGAIVEEGDEDRLSAGDGAQASARSPRMHRGSKDGSRKMISVAALEKALEVSEHPSPTGG